MATIYNSDLTKELTKGAGLQTSKDVIPNQIAEKVVPVMEVNPKLLRVVNVHQRNTATNATSATIYTTPADRDFYLTGLTISMIKDATATSTSSFISVYINGLQNQIAHIVSLTLTPQYAAYSKDFTVPIKLDRNTAIVIGNATNVANITSSGTIQGYIVDTSNA